MDVSGIASMSMYMSQAKLMQDLGTAVMDMALDTTGTQAQSDVALMEASVNPDIGGNIDLLV